MIFLKRRDGSLIETLIDTSDLPRVKEFGYSWYATWQKNTKSFYVQGARYINGKQQMVMLHRWILQPPKEMEVDHINHNTLDNRRSNLRLVTPSENKQNMHSAPRNNKTSGIRGVCWDRSHNLWKVYVTVKGKRSWLGYFKTIQEAEQAAVDARAKMMPYSKEATQMEILNGMMEAASTNQLTLF